MSEASYFKRELAVACGGALLIGVGAAYLASEAPQRPIKTFASFPEETLGIMQPRVFTRMTGDTDDQAPKALS